MNKSINSTLYISNFINLFLEKKILILFFFLIIFLGYLIGYNFVINNNEDRIKQYEYEIRYNIKENRDFFRYRLNVSNMAGAIANNFEVNESNLNNDEFLSLFSYMSYSEQATNFKDYIYGNLIANFIDLYKDPKNKNSYLVTEKINKISGKMSSEFFRHKINYDDSYIESNIALIQFNTEDKDTALYLIEDYAKFISSSLKNRFIDDFEKAIKNVENDKALNDNKVFINISGIIIENLRKEIDRIDYEDFLIINSDNVSINQTSKLSKIIEIGIASSNTIYYPIIFTILLSFLYLTIIIFIYRKKIYNENN